MKDFLDKCCGLDVHKKTVVACVMIGTGRDMKKEIRTFSTLTKDLIELIELRDWLKSLKITHAAMESTGVYWKPIFNL